MLIKNIRYRLFINLFMNWKKGKLKIESLGLEICYWNERRKREMKKELGGKKEGRKGEEKWRWNV